MQADLARQQDFSSFLKTKKSLQAQSVASIPKDYSFRSTVKRVSWLFTSIEAHQSVAMFDMLCLLSFYLFAGQVFFTFKFGTEFLSFVFPEVLLFEN